MKDIQRGEKSMRKDSTKMKEMQIFKNCLSKLANIKIEGVIFSASRGAEKQATPLLMVR